MPKISIYRNNQSDTFLIESPIVEWPFIDDPLVTSHSNPFPNMKHPPNHTQMLHAGIFTYMYPKNGTVMYKVGPPNDS